jgi:hypothetical protein
MAITLSTTTGTQADLDAAMGRPATPPPLEATDAATPVVTATPQLDATAPDPVETPAADAAPVDAAPVAAAEDVVPDSEFDEDGEPTTERAARSSHTKLQTIKKLRVRARDAEQRAARLEGENAVLRSGVVSPGPVAPVPSAEIPSAMFSGLRPKPTPEDINPATGELVFRTNEDYVEALTDWKLDARDVARQQADSQKQLASKIQTFAQAHPDYNEVVANPQIFINAAQQQVLHDPDNADAPAMAYALAKDPALCETIRQLPYAKALVAMGKLQARLASTPSNGDSPGPVSPMAPSPAAPPPPKPLRGVASPSSVTIEALAKAGDIHGFIAARNAEEQRRRMTR